MWALLYFVIKMGKSKYRFNVSGEEIRMSKISFGPYAFESRNNNDLDRFPSREKKQDKSPKTFLPTLCSGSTIIRCVSMGLSVKGRSASTTKGPNIGSNSIMLFFVSDCSKNLALASRGHQGECVLGWDKGGNKLHKNCSIVKFESGDDTQAR